MEQITRYVMQGYLKTFYFISSEKQRNYVIHILHFKYINIDNIIYGEVMDNEIQQDKLRFFIKTGVVVLSFLVLMFLGIKYIPAAISVSNSANSRELPIYCVNEDENKVALSFDAAWGNDR
jgi:hypothetical protein